MVNYNSILTIQEIHEIYIVKLIIGKANDKSTLPDIFQMDVIKGTDRIAAADGFNSFFVNVGKSTSNSINHMSFRF